MKFLLLPSFLSPCKLFKKRQSPFCKKIKENDWQRYKGSIHRSHENVELSHPFFCASCSNLFLSDFFLHGTYPAPMKLSVHFQLSILLHENRNKRKVFRAETLGKVCCRSGLFPMNRKCGNIGF